MISRRSEFKFIDRRHKNTMLLVPGWATDYRVFGLLDVPFNYLVPEKFSPFNFEGPLLDALEDAAIKRISIFGWSMGAFVAADLAVRHGEKIDDITIVGARPKYDEGTIGNIRAYLKRNKKGYLYKFYSDCFSETEKELWSLFKTTLLKTYVKEMDSDTLMEGLDYLTAAEFKLDSLVDLNLTFIHGSLDKIAPIGESLAFKQALPKAVFITIDGAGHAPFLRPDFTGCYG